MKKASNNSVFELANLHANFMHELKRFSLVSEYVPATLKKELDKLDKKIQKEMESRGL